MSTPTTPTGYVEVTVVVDGALDDTCEFPLTYAGDRALEEYVEMIRRFAIDRPWTTEIYAFCHLHPVMVEDECHCAQYETDHHPTWTFGESVH